VGCSATGLRGARPLVVEGEGALATTVGWAAQWEKGGSGLRGCERAN